MLKSILRNMLSTDHSNENKKFKLFLLPLWFTNAILLNKLKDYLALI